MYSKAAAGAALCCVLAACAARPVTSPDAAHAIPPYPAAAGTAESGAPESGAAARAARLAATALDMVGTPYRYGGSDPTGFDCSGLVDYAAGSVGLSLPRTAQEQLQVGTSVKRRDLRAGDLVFMHLAAKELHVGIAVDPGRFVHSPSTGGRVRVDSLYARPYREGFFAARRIVP